MLSLTLHHQTHSPPRQVFALTLQSRIAPPELRSAKMGKNPCLHLICQHVPQKILAKLTTPTPQPLSAWKCNHPSAPENEKILESSIVLPSKSLRFCPNLSTSCGFFGQSVLQIFIQNSQKKESWWSPKKRTSTSALMKCRPSFNVSCGGNTRHTMPPALTVSQAAHNVSAEACGRSKKTFRWNTTVGFLCGTNNNNWICMGNRCKTLSLYHKGQSVACRSVKHPSEIRLWCFAIDWFSTANAQHTGSLQSPVQVSDSGDFSDGH